MGTKYWGLRLASWGRRGPCWAQLSIVRPRGHVEAQRSMDSSVPLSFFGPGRRTALAFPH